MTGAAKLSDLRGFQRHLKGLGIPGGPVRKAMAVLVSVAEVAIGLGLVLGLLLRAATVAAFLLFGCFMLVLTVSRLRHNDTPCRCFGALTGKVSARWEIVRGGVFTLGAAACVAAAWSGSVPAFQSQAVLAAVPLTAGWLVLGLVTVQAARAMSALDALRTARS